MVADEEKVMWLGHLLGSVMCVSFIALLLSLDKKKGIWSVTGLSHLFQSCYG